MNLNNTDSNYTLTEEPTNDLEKLEIKLLLDGLYAWCGYDYRDYAYPSIKRRVQHRMQAEKLPTITSLLNKVLHDPTCLQRLIADFSINVTEMFRDPLFFKDFRENVVPLLKTYPSIRIWHAGCASGEEVYSMAILLQEEGLYEKAKIYATDINSDVLKIAKNGFFPLEHMRKYTQNYMQAGGQRAFSDYYKVTNAGVKFDHSLMKNVVFAQHNLVTDSSFNEFHVILCRNVLIYFNKDLQNKVHELFYESLGMFGFLGLGDKETIYYTDYANVYEDVSKKQKIYRKVK
ncbi:chemotaxis protein methyltransferase CheR [Lysinibacillus composti]|uniref:Protein-glutamate O-methyltransferase CheR n=1 Tax=Lysinibacillus composti TaxID=720633 RepID=A0A3N9UHY8_9BACI|nr:protein-glutamate O-methyltransferase CheR [Lysinibacillus composti]MBM7607788.1 chemotaxis protein methyltransferase CheR [Lysinibacillus composti]RQW75723.1 protein-glutamate O-methyltransferase CheR [Lysinibacillus composti]